MIPEDNTIEGAPMLTIADRELVREEACSYKAVLASQSITDLLEAIHVGDILQRIAEVTGSGTVEEDLIRARDLKEEIDKLQLDLDEGNVAESDRAFVEADIQKKQNFRVEILASAMREQSQAPAQYYAIIANSLPVIFAEAPELIYKFCALMMVPNEDLEKAFRKGKNGIKKLVDDNKAWLMFSCKHWEPLEIASFYIPALGLDVLKKAGGDMITEMTSMMAVSENGTHSDTSSKSSSPNLELVETS